MKNLEPPPESFFYKKNILITGASGFIGSWLVNELISHDSIIFTLSRKYSDSFKLINNEKIKKINQYTGNIHEISSITKIMESTSIDIIFHLAAVNTNFGTNYSPLGIFETNIRGTYNVLESARSFSNGNITVVTLSSREVEENMKNTSKKNSAYHPYAISKQCSDMLCHSYAHTYNMNICILLSSNVYGGGQLNWERIIPGTIRSLNNKERLLIRSSGNLSRNYIYVSDIVSALLFVARLNFVKNNAVVYNLKDRDILKTSDLVKMIGKLYNNGIINMDIINNSFDEKEVIATSRENEIDSLGWTPQYNISEGIKLTLKWYKNYFDKV